MFPFMFKPASTTNINVLITPITTFDTLVYVAGYSAEDFPDTYMKQIGGQPIKCNSFEMIEQAYRKSEHYEKFDGKFKVTISGSIADREVNEVFFKTYDLKSFLEEIILTQEGSSALTTFRHG